MKGFKSSRAVGRYADMGDSRGRIVFLAILGLVAVSIGGLAGRANLPEMVPLGDVPVTVGPPPAEPTVKVHVSGMVVAPGVVDVPPDGILADAIDAAGGLRPGALVDQINLAAPVAAGDQIIVPGPGEEDPHVGNAEGGDGVISLNRATATDLEALPGVGPVLAGRIVSFREQNGRFERVEDLLEVPGIGEAKLAAIRDLVRP